MPSSKAAECPNWLHEMVKLGCGNDTTAGPNDVDDAKGLIAKIISIIGGIFNIFPLLMGYILDCPRLVYSLLYNHTKYVVMCVIFLSVIYQYCQTKHLTFEVARKDFLIFVNQFFKRIYRVFFC